MRSSAGCSAKSEAVDSTAAISSGASRGQQEQREQEFAHAGVRGNAEKTVPVTDRPSVPSDEDENQAPEAMPASEML